MISETATSKDDLSAVHLWLVLWRTTRAVGRRAEESIAQFDMVPSDFGVLEALLHRGPLNATQLGAKVLLKSGSVTAALDRLAARGLIRRTDDAEDRRACIVELTAAGRALIESAFAQHKQEMEDALQDFPAAERGALLPLLRRLGRIAEPAQEISDTARGRMKRNRKRVVAQKEQ